MDGNRPSRQGSLSGRHDELPQKEHEVDEHVVLRKLQHNILWLFFGMTVLCWLDRTSLAFAALQLNRSLGFSEVVYGLGSSIFFVGYSLFQVPSNLILVRVGAPVWLSTIVVAWGLVAICFAFMRNRLQFYLLRLLLGVTEAGSFPGMWYHLSLFFSEKDLGLAYAYVTLGSAVSQIIGGPLASALLSLDGCLGLAGWQWLFIMEGIPTVLLGIWMRSALVESPAKARFLQPQEREWVQQRVAKAWAGKASAEQEQSTWSAVCNWRVWWLACVAMMEATVKYGVVYWCPLIIRSMLVPAGSTRPISRELKRATAIGSRAQSHAFLRLRRMLADPGSSGEAASAPRSAVVGASQHGHVEGASVLNGPSEGASPLANASSALVALLTSVPFGSAAAAMLLCARHSQATGEKRLHAAVPLAIAALSLAVMALWIDDSPMFAFVALLLATTLWAPAGILSSLPATFLKGPAAATGVALINSIANTGGMVGPALIGAIKHHYETYAYAIMALAGVTAAACILVWYLPLPGFAAPAQERAPLKSVPADDSASVLARLRDRPGKRVEQD